MYRKIYKYLLHIVTYKCKIVAKFNVLKFHCKKTKTKNPKHEQNIKGN